jgi:hypothetical protein
MISGVLDTSRVCYFARVYGNGEFLSFFGGDEESIDQGTVSQHPEHAGLKGRFAFEDMLLGQWLGKNGLHFLGFAESLDFDAVSLDVMNL